MANKLPYIPRFAISEIAQYRKIFPVVALLGPRQCGKSTLIKHLIAEWDKAAYLDLQNPGDVLKLADPTIFFEANAAQIICLDEVQMMPELFAVLRSIVDSDRKNGQIILLGSASRDLLQKSSETLAGRIGYVNLTPFTIDEIFNIDDFDLNKFWLRGGFPNSYLSESDENSAIWRQNFISTFIERDIPQFGFNIPALQLRRFITMCAHNQGQLLNLSKLASSMSLTHPTIKRYVDLLEQTFVLRSLPPFETNTKKRIVKTPKVYIRDSGIMHQLLRIADFNELLGHPVFGPSWEGMAIENILTRSIDWTPSFFRTATGDELDLIIQKGQRCIAFEFKSSKSPNMTKGFWRALDIVRPDLTFIVAPISGRPYSIKENVTVISLADCILQGIQDFK